jgi:hypothetical protein
VTLACTFRRGFALPIVIVLALVVGIMAAVVLERQAYQRQVVARQLFGYQDTHFERGVREVVGQWTDSLIGQPIDKMISSDGHALDIQRPDGSLLSVYLFDGQGSILTELNGLSQADAADGQGILDAMHVKNPKPDLSDVRPVGPVRVCVGSASADVLDAIGTYAKGGKSARRFVESLLDARKKKGELTDSDLGTAMNAADLTGDQQAIARRLLVLKPELWNMVVDVYQPTARGGGDLVARYGGRFLLANYGGGGGNTGRQTTMVSLGKFLWWEHLPIEEETPH